MSTVKTKETIAAEFMADLKALLAKHKAEIEIETTQHSYYESTKLVATISAEYCPETFECKSEWTEIELGSYVSAESCDHVGIRGI